MADAEAPTTAIQIASVRPEIADFPLPILGLGGVTYYRQHDRAR